MLNISIIDGYIDEPTCLGVPPYISPYPRYISGAIWDFDKTANIKYYTIDQIRNNYSLINEISDSDYIFVISGISVPGRYLSGFPASPKEIHSLMKEISNSLKILCGPAARYGFGIAGGSQTKEIGFVDDVFDLIISGDCEIIVSDILKYKNDIDRVNTSKLRKKAKDIRDFAIKGADIVKQHPLYPFQLITEVETYRGCPRYIVGGCSFCSEPLKGLPDFREIKDITDEIKRLYQNGIQHFRLGNQPCIFSYMSKDADKEEFPKPNPNAIEKLFKGIRSVAPFLKTLHIDNANPGIISRYPLESRAIAKTIIKYHTSGDVAAFGVESVDPVVIKKNNLKATADEVFFAIDLLNKVGSRLGSNGMPELLPGLNFVFGLDGETKETYEFDYDFLKKVLDNDLLLRRINLRKIIPIPGTKMYNINNKLIKKNRLIFKKFKIKVNQTIDLPMLKNMLPRTNILRDILTEKYIGKVTFGRQMGSYPLLVGIPGLQSLGKYIDIKITEYGYRSITGVPFPLDINNAQRETIEGLPNIGRKRANRILLNRPFTDKDEFLNSIDDIKIGTELLEFIEFN